MSYILDAIKESDRKRGRSQQVPDVNTWQPEGRPLPPPRRRWWLGLGLGIGLMALLGGWLLFGHLSTSSSGNAQAVAPAPVSQPAEPVQPVSEESEGEMLQLPQEARQLALPIHLDQDEAPPPARRLATASGQASARTPARAGPDSATDPQVALAAAPRSADVPLPARAATEEPAAPLAPASRPAAVPSAPPEEDSALAGVPNWRQLPVAVQRRLPELVFTLHVYDKEPSYRMVKVNGRVAREGQYVGTSLKLEQIVPDGVILSFEGEQFLMKVN